MDTRVFLIHLFKLFIETLSENAVSQRTPSKVLVEVLEEAKADNLERVEETKEYIFLEWRSSLPKKRRISLVYRWSLWDMEEVQARQVEHEIKTGHGTIIVLDSLSHDNDEDNSATSTSLLEERRVLFKERESKKQDFKTTKLQALKEVRDRAEKLNPSSDISDETEPFAHAIYKAYQKGVLFEEIKEILQQKKAQTLQKKGDVFLHRPKPAEVVQPPDLSEIVPWGSKEKSGPASKYLQDNYGHLLKLYNRELDRDLICLQDLKVHDKTLWQGLYSEAKKTGIKPSEYVASKSQRTKEAALGTDIDKVRELEREAARQRQAMRRHGISLESLKNKP